MSPVITRLGTRARHVLAGVVAASVAVPLSTLAFVEPAAAHPGHGDTEPFDVLVFSKTAGFRHGSIPSGIAAIQQLGADHGFTVDSTEDAADFTEENLAQYEAVVWLSTTGDVLNAEQQAAFEGYVQAGGGYAGIHAASDTEYDWDWYGDLVGAYFLGHPQNQDAEVKIEDPAHPSTAGLPPVIERYDEWYNFRSNPRDNTHVLASLDETTYDAGGGAMGAEHPISWCQDYDGGRSWYTGMGHTNESFAEPEFLDHILGGIRTAAGVLPADCAATSPSSFEKITLDDTTSNPMELDIAEDGRVFYVDRNGAVRVIQPGGGVSTAGTIPVYTGQEFGLLGLALDPDFAENNWLYLYYSPQGSDPVDRVVRYTMEGDTLQTSSAELVLEIPVQRDQCCHAGGALEFDNAGNLYIATGDNTNPFDSNGYAPIDERNGRSAWDAQRTSANTNSLSGKVLKITPLDEGGYSIPEGNLFAEGTEDTRPEIYAMGFRNPFRIGLDEQNDNLLVADYGPDAGGSGSPDRGPNGIVEWNILDEPGNYGWPYCVGDNKPYIDYNFANSTSGAAFDCANPVNNSPNNTGLTELPAAKEAVIWQSNNASITSTPEIGASGAPMTSGTYDFDPELVSNRKWPEYFDSKAIWADWNNSRLFTVQMNQDGSDYTDINRLLPSLAMSRPHALQFGPDGALYMIEWGSGFGGNNADSGVYRIDYVSGNRAPIASASADVTSGPAPLTVQFDSTGSRDPDGTPITYEWDFGDGSAVSTEENPTHTYTEEGNYTARLTVTDEGERTGVSNIDIVVGNTAPTVELTIPLDGGFFEFGDVLRYEVEVTDPEDGTEIDCDRVVVQPALGHDEHAHGYEQYTGCEGQFPLPGDEGHIGANIFGTVTATYTDGGGAGEIAPLTGQDTIVVHTKRKEAEFFDQTGRTGEVTGGDAGVQVEDSTDDGGGQNIGYIEVGDWFAWDVMNLSRIDSITLRGASQPAGGGTWEARQGSPDGPTVATFVVPTTGGWQEFEDITSDVTGASEESEPLYFVATAGAANVNWLNFNGIGVTFNRAPALQIGSDVTSGEGPLTVAFTSESSDPDGDTPIEIEWDFGDGTPVSTEANPTHVYQVAGTYEVRATATDSRGATRTRTLEIQVTGGGGETCFTGRSDGFDGTELDTSRWTNVVRGNQELTVAGGTLNIPMANADLYQDSNTAPNIVLQPLPGGAFEVTTKVAAPIDRQWQQAGLIMYGDDDNYVKLVVGGRSAEPNKSNNIIQFSKELAGAVTENNGPNLGADFPDTVWLRLSSTNGLDLTASYSADGEEWTTLSSGAQHDLAGINEPRMGLTAFANTEAGAGITAEFDYFSITPDDSAEPCGEEPETCLTGRSDHFTGEALDEERWNTIVRPSGNISVADSQLTIPMTATDLYQGTNTTPDLVLQDLPAGEFEVTTKVTAPIVRQYQQAGLLLYGDDDNYLKLVVQGRSAQPDKAANIVQFAREADATAAETNTSGLGADFPDTVWLRMVSEDGVDVEGYYSTDGEEWTQVGTVTYSAAHLDEPKVGLVSLANNAEGAGIDARFDYFEITPDDTAVPCEEPGGDETAPTTTITVDPAEADGEEGWYVSAPSFTLEATDGEDGSGVAGTEYRIGDGAWTDYTGEAVEVEGQGSITIEYRSTDEAGNVEEAGSTTVQVDLTAPAVEATVTGTYTGEMEALDGSDLGGTATMTSELDGEEGSTTASLSLTGLAQDTAYESHLHVGTCDTLGLHYMDDPAGPGTPPNELWPTNPGWTEGPRIVADADGSSEAEATVAWAPRTDGRALVLHREGAIVGCATLDLTGPGTVHLAASDAHSGVASVEYRLGEGEWVAYEDPFVVDEPGTTTVDWRAADVAGNSVEGSFDVEVPEGEGPTDPEAPTVTVGTTPAAPNGKNGWYTRSVSLTATATGGTGALTIERRVNGGEWVTHTGTYRLTQDGSYRVQFQATDAEGVVSEWVTQVVDIDRTAPVARVSNLAQGRTFGLAARHRVGVVASDTGSGLDVRRVLLDGEQVGTPVQVDAVELLTGRHVLRLVVVDRAGNRAVQRVVFRVRADYAGARGLARRLAREDRLPQAAGNRMTRLVNQAAQADRQGRDRIARQRLNQVRKLSVRATDRTARVAVRDAAVRLTRQL